MDVNDNARCLDKGVAVTFFASKLAPTRDLQIARDKKNAPNRKIGGVFVSGANVISL